MDSTALRELQAPLTEQYRSDPASALIVLRAEGTLDEQKIACKIETGRAIAMADPTSRASGQTNAGVDAAVGIVVQTMPARREPTAIHWSL